LWKVYFGVCVIFLMASFKVVFTDFNILTVAYFGISAVAIFGLHGYIFDVKHFSVKLWKQFFPVCLLWLSVCIGWILLSGAFEQEKASELIKVFFILLILEVPKFIAIYRYTYSWAAESDASDEPVNKNKEKCWHCTNRLCLCEIAAQRNHKASQRDLNYINFSKKDWGTALFGLPFFCASLFIIPLSFSGSGSPGGMPFGLGLCVLLMGLLLGALSFSALTYVGGIKFSRPSKILTDWSGFVIPLKSKTYQFDAFETIEIKHLVTRRSKGRRGRYEVSLRFKSIEQLNVEPKSNIKIKSYLIKNKSLAAAHKLSELMGLDVTVEDKKINTSKNDTHSYYKKITLWDTNK